MISPRVKWTNDFVGSQGLFGSNLRRRVNITHDNLGRINKKEIGTTVDKHQYGDSLWICYDYKNGTTAKSCIDTKVQKFISGEILQ